MLQATIVSLVSWGLGGQFVALLCGHWCLGAVGVAGADGGRHASRVAGSVDVSHGDDGGEIAVGVVRAGSGGDSGRVHTSRPLAPGGDLLLLPERLLLPPLGGSRGAGHQAGNKSGDDSLPLADVMGNLTRVGNLGSPPSSSSGRARDQSGDIAGSYGEGGLPLTDVVGNLSCVGNLGCPPLGSGGGAGHQAGDVAGGDGHSGGPLAV